MRSVITLLLLFSYSASFSCYNEYYALDAKGHFHQIEPDNIRFNQHFDLKSIEKQLISLEKALQTKPDFKLLSNYALHLVQAGKVKEALVIFEKLAEIYPEEYSIAANLGTTYELSGQNEKALEYIRKGIQLNPGSHGGSEWIHVKILEAKIALEKDPDYLSSHSVLNLNSKQKQSQKVFDQLFIQLQERFPFSPKAANPVMADLFVELGDFYFETISFEHAKAFYQIASLYYQSDRTDIDEKIERARKLRETFSGSQPGESSIEHGTSIKVIGVPYQNYVYNPSGSKYSIDWSRVEVNPDKLLAYIDLKLTKEQVLDEKPATSSSKVETVHSKSGKKADNSMLWMGLTLVVLIVSIFTYFKAKKKKR